MSSTSHALLFHLAYTVNGRPESAIDDAAVTARRITASHLYTAGNITLRRATADEEKRQLYTVTQNNGETTTAIIADQHSIAAAINVLSRKTTLGITCQKMTADEMQSFWQRPQLDDDKYYVTDNQQLNVYGTFFATFKLHDSSPRTIRVISTDVQDVIRQLNALNIPPTRITSVRAANTSSD